MTDDRYARFELPRPRFLADEYWRSIELELSRLERSLGARDDSQVLGDLKCLVEAVAKVVLDVNGTPSDSNSKFPAVVSRAHDLLRTQKGQELAYDSPYNALAVQASKIAISLAQIRNAHGAGHGRARQPVVRNEMVDLALDGSFTWLRWACRRVGLFSEGRPDQLIRALVDEPATFTSGMLARRLVAADLPGLEDHHQRALGVAVGQRSARETFVVYADGMRPAIESADLVAWPTAYRLGLAHGILFDPSEQSTVVPLYLQRSMEVLTPVQNQQRQFGELVESVIDHYAPEAESDQDGLNTLIRRLIVLETKFDATMKDQLRRLTSHLQQRRQVRPH